MRNNRIFIAYLSIGSGHQVAAEALAASMRKGADSDTVAVIDPFADQNKIVPSVLNALQTASIVLAPDAYDIAWRRKVSYDTYQWITHIQLLQEFLKKKILENRSDVIVATHVLPCILAVGLKKRSIVKKVFGVITDFSAHSLWPTEEVDGYFVASDEIKNLLVFRGIDAKTINVTGIPIHKIPQPSYIKPTKNKLRVLLVAGGIRGGGYVGQRRYCCEILEEAIKHQIDFNLTIIAGHQKQLQQDLTLYKSRVTFDLRIHSRIKQMSKFLINNDVLITKPGGLILSEALARGICIILSQPGPGQESANLDFLARHGAALNGEDPKEVIYQINFLSQNTNIVDEIKFAAKRLGYPNSSETISKIIIDAIGS